MRPAQQGVWVCGCVGVSDSARLLGLVSVPLRLTELPHHHHHHPLQNKGLCQHPNQWRDNNGMWHPNQWRDAHGNWWNHQNNQNDWNNNNQQWRDWNDPNNQWGNNWNHQVSQRLDLAMRMPELLFAAALFKPP